MDSTREYVRARFHQALVGADRSLSRQVLREALAEGCAADWLLLQVVQPSLNQIGADWSAGGATLSQVYVAGKIAEDACATLVPLLASATQEETGVVIGTIAGDFHGLGRVLVASFLRADGCRVVDVGLGAEPAVFVETAAREQAQVIAISALMLHTTSQIALVRPMLEARGMSHVRILVGGAPFNYDPELFRRVGADGTAPHAGAAAQVVRELKAGWRRRP